MECEAQTTRRVNHFPSQQDSVRTEARENAVSLNAMTNTGYLPTLSALAGGDRLHLLAGFPPGDKPFMAEFPFLRSPPALKPSNTAPSVPACPPSRRESLNCKKDQSSPVITRKVSEKSANCFARPKRRKRNRQKTEPLCTDISAKKEC